MFRQVRRLVLVESTALFDTAGIDLKAHKPVKVKTKGNLAKRVKTGKHAVNVLYEDIPVWLNICVCVCVRMQKVVFLVFPLPLYWIRTRGGLLGPKCHSSCKG